ncbi:MAG: hypothetical protein RLZZ453_697 [Chlamydiota bacterium]
MCQRVLYLLGMVVLAGCSQAEVEEEEPDYDEMVMLDDEVSEEERDRKMIVDALPDPQELILIEPVERE